MGLVKTTRLLGETSSMIIQIKIVFQAESKNSLYALPFHFSMFESANRLVTVKQEQDAPYIFVESRSEKYGGLGKIS